MEKIIKLALEAKGFSASVIDAVYEVAIATGNTEVAINKLLGFYEVPGIAKQSDVYADDVVCTFKSYNPFRDVVFYSYTVIKRINKDGTWIDDPNGTVEESTYDCSLSRWNKHAIATSDE